MKENVRVFFSEHSVLFTVAFS